MTPFSLDRSPTPGVEIQASVMAAILDSLEPRSLLALITTVSAIVAAIYLYFGIASLALVLLTVAAIAVQTVRLPRFLDRNLAFSDGSFHFVHLWLDAKMRHVNEALDEEVLSLSQAAALGDKAGEKIVIQIFQAAEPTLRHLLGVPAAALLKVDRDKGSLIPTAQYGLTGINPILKLTGCCFLH